MAATIRLSQQHSCSLDHLNDPLPRGSRRFRRHVLVSDGSTSPVAANVLRALHSPLHAGGVVDHRFWISAVLLAASVGWDSHRAGHAHAQKGNSPNVYAIIYSTLGSSQRFWSCSGPRDCGEIAWISPWPGSESF